MRSAARRLARSVVGFALNTLPRDLRRRLKEYFELRFWSRLGQNLSRTRVLSRQGVSVHEPTHYQYFYTEQFGLSVQDYSGKKVLDIGCGPMGSLEWADNASLRIGLDPLAHKYRSLPLGAAHHRMQYVAGTSERLPFQSSVFDFVTTFNNLDHVEDVATTIREIMRVASAGACVLVITEIEHQPTFTEPHRLGLDVTKFFAPEFAVESCQLFGVRSDHDLYASIREKLPYAKGKRGILCAKLVRAVPAPSR